MDEKPKINLAAYMSFTVTLTMNLLFLLSQFEIRTMPREVAVVLYFPTMLFAIISGINGKYNVAKYKMKGRILSILGIVGVIIIPIVSFLKFWQDVSSINN
jgi:hypothetical protein